MPLLVAEITAPHGIRGAFKVKSYTEEPLELLNFPELRDADGRVYRFQLLRQLVGEFLLVTMVGVTDRDQAERLRGTKLLIERESLPPTVEEDEFYYTDLIGCTAFEVGGGAFGQVLSVQDYGAGVLLEVGLTLGGVSQLVPFTRESVPEVDIEKKIIWINLPNYDYPEKSEVEDDASTRT